MTPDQAPEPDPRTVEITGVAHATVDVFDFLRTQAAPSPPPPDEPADAGGSDRPWPRTS